MECRVELGVLPHRGLLVFVGVGCRAEVTGAANSQANAVRDADVQRTRR